MSHTVARMLRLPWVLYLCGALAACSTPKPWLNPPLQPGEAVRYDGRAQLFDTTRLPEVLVVASFSGGGSRAAAFAQAVVAALDDQPFDWHGRHSTLAREIDMVIGVSGGSIAAAHLALHGVAEHLRRFDSDFLAVDFQSRLTAALLSPTGLHDLSSPWYGRGNLLADEFDALLFQGATFGRLGQRPAHPYLIVGATDLSTGAEFDFTSDQMARLCSSIDPVPLSFAVAASSSVPLLFSPLSVRVHRAPCAHGDVALAPTAPVDSDSARVKLTKGEFEAQSHGQRQYIHLVDGGLSDNLGTRRITDYVAQMGGIGAVLQALQGVDGRPGTLPRRIVFIAVNSERQGPLPLDQRGEVPTLFEVADAMIFGGLGRSSRETALVFAEAVKVWRQELRALGNAGADADVFAIQINLSDVGNSSLREQVLAIPTSLRITPQDLDLLRLAARAGLAESADYQRFLASVGAR